MKKSKKIKVGSDVRNKYNGLCLGTVKEIHSVKGRLVAKVQMFDGEIIDLFVSILKLV